MFWKNKNKAKSVFYINKKKVTQKKLVEYFFGKKFFWDTSSTYMKVGIPNGWLGRRSTTTGIFVQQEAKDVQQEKDRYDV